MLDRAEISAYDTGFDLSAAHLKKRAAHVAARSFSPLD
jgi:hypothetical protein